MSERLAGSLYDYPQYYDLVFGSDWKAEQEFLRACFARYAGRRVRRIFEPACGTGRLLFRLARSGYRVAGLDLNEAAVAYCNARLARHGCARSVFVGDMCDFQLARPVDACFNMINSFRHLATERQAVAHLRCVSEALQPGGLYVLGIHLTPTQGTPMEEEAWSARRGHLQVNTRLTTVRRDPARREEWFTMECDIYTPTRRHSLREEIMFRSYTARQFQHLLNKIPDLETVATHDFTYEIKQPVDVLAESEDIVFVLRKRGGKSARS
jgi:SAM-dependent methyltransferase